MSLEICKKTSRSRFKRFVSVSQDSGELSRYSDGLRPVFDSRQGQEICLYYTESKLAVELNQPPIQWVTGALSPGVTRRGVKLTTHSHLLPRARMVELCLRSPIHLHDMVLN
jgi:hypothetical protein